MIKLPKEIVQMIRTIEDAGFEAYAVGGCVRDSILGKHPEDWDLTSNASRDTLEALFPDAAIVNRKLGVMRISEGEVTADLAAYRIDGEYKDYRRPETVIFTEEINEDLKRRDFTMNAIAVSPDRGVVDPYCGREDINRKLIRGIGNPKVRFEEDALRILRAVRFAAQLGFEIEAETLNAIQEKADLLAFISVERIREELVKTITAENGGRGLALIAETGVLPYILRNVCRDHFADMDHIFESDQISLEPIAGSEQNRLTLLAKNINRSKPDAALRLAMFYQCFDRDRALGAIENLLYSNEMKKLLQYAVDLTDELEGIRGKADLKRLIGRIGMKYYSYLDDLSEQRRRVFGIEIESLGRRRSMFEEMRLNSEPVFIEDLAINGGDLIEHGIKEGVEIGRLLNLLLDTVHEDPGKNEKNLLLEIAEKNYVRGIC